MLIKNYLPVQNCLFNALRIPSNNNTEPIFQVCMQDYHCKTDKDCVTGKCNYDGKCDCDSECITGSKCTNDHECGISGGVTIGSCNSKFGCLCPPPPVSFGLRAQTPFICPPRFFKLLSLQNVANIYKDWSKNSWGWGYSCVEQFWQHCRGWSFRWGDTRTPISWIPWSSTRTW